MSNSIIPATMRAVIAEEPGAPEQMKIKEFPVPTPGAEEVLIKVAATALNRADILQRMGRYDIPDGITKILGLECSGEIVALGEGTTRYKIGDQVCALLPGGGYAEYAVAPEGQCLPIPAGVDRVAAAALPEATFTVWANLFQLGKLKDGQHVLIHGGSSGIGTYAIQMAAAAGAKPIATVGSAEKEEACKKLGAVLTINYRNVDYVKVVKEFTKNEGVDVVLDMIGADYIPRNLNCLAYRGRHVSIAAQHGWLAAINLRDMMYRRLMMTGSTMRWRTVEEKSRLANEVEAYVWPWIAEGKVKPVIHQTFPLDKVVDAHNVMHSSTHIGKLVLKVS